MSPDYTEHDVQRQRVEVPKAAAINGSSPQQRSVFARDRARVLHSAALRRLAGKTQVVDPAEDDVPRTRLTHSLEVAQIGRAIAEELGCDPDLVDAAGLAHDLGHPPFGHNGERALNEIIQHCGGFEGNAQTLRILTRLEPKAGGDGELAHGLNLTRASLDAAVKYPWPRTRLSRKFGVYADDMPVFEWLRVGAPRHRRCLEAQVMDWADDVAYSVHDVEDGVLAGRIALRALSDATERAEIVALAAQRWRTDSDPEGAGSDLDQLELAARRLSELAPVTAVVEYDGLPKSRVALKWLTSELVERFVVAAVSGTRAAVSGFPLTRYAADLVVADQIVAEVAVLKAMADRYVVRDPHRVRMQTDQRFLLAELVDGLSQTAPESLDPLFQPAWSQAATDDQRLRVVVDQVASLTDAQAVRWHQWNLRETSHLACR